MSTDIIEKKFREVESSLDNLLNEAESDLRSIGLSFEDESARTYHYKNDHLFWCYSFRKEWLVDVQRVCITCRIYCGEPVSSDDAPEIEVSWRAEIYRQGNISRIDNRGKKINSLQHFLHEGISRLVVSTIDEGSSSLPDRYRSILVWPTDSI